MNNDLFAGVEHADDATATSALTDGLERLAGSVSDFECVPVESGAELGF